MSKTNFKYLPFIICIIILGISLSSCRKELLYKGNEKILSFSSDTLQFDTVFTQIGTVTRFFKIENPSQNAILLKKIELMNLNGLNTFRINVDGVSGTKFENITIPPKDFIYVFAEATIDPMNLTNPFVILDEIRYSFNDVIQSSYLEAWGRDAYFHRGEVYIGKNITWLADKPHVILRDDTFPGVGVDSSSVLNIEPGCEIYSAQGTGIFVDGELHVGALGNQDSVVFRSARIETLQNEINFEENPGLWQGITLFSGSKATFYNVCINQAIWGLQIRRFSEDINDMLVDAARPEVILDKVQIKNSALNALIALNADLTVTNSIFYYSGANTVAIALGGKAKFDNCTIYNNGVAGSDDSEGLILSNFVQTSQGTGVHPLESADFTNVLIHGNASEQLIFSEDDLVDFNYNFTNCLLKTELESQGGFTNCLFNQDPLFEDANDANFNLRDNSPCINAGVDNGITEDIYFSPRLSFDIGAVAY